MISIIISTNNELRNTYLQKVIDWILNQKWDFEIIFVDNWSKDWTINLCKKYWKVFDLENSNRAERLNFWVKKAKWNIILFHHSVSILPKNIFWKIKNKISQWAKWWWLSHSFDSNHFLLNFTSWYSNKIRWKLKWVLYLDHCIFVEKKSFEKIWWFKNLDIFEDTVFSYDLKKQFWKPTILKEKIITSARRFTKRWIFKQGILNQYLKIIFHFWFSHKKMNKIYEEKDGFNVKY